LDTGLSDSDLRRIAGALRASPFDPAEVERILRDEVMPAFGLNLASIAGDWIPWTEGSIRMIMERS